MKRIIITSVYKIDLNELKSKYGIDLTDVSDEEAKRIIDKWFEIYKETATTNELSKWDVVSWRT